MALASAWIPKLPVKKMILTIHQVVSHPCFLVIATIRFKSCYPPILVISHPSNLLCFGQILYCRFSTSAPARWTCANLRLQMGLRWEQGRPWDLRAWQEEDIGCRGLHVAWSVQGSGGWRPHWCDDQLSRCAEGFHDGWRWQRWQPWLVFDFSLIHVGNAFSESNTSSWSMLTFFFGRISQGEFYLKPKPNEMYFAWGMLSTNGVKFTAMASAFTNEAAKLQPRENVQHWMQAKHLDFCSLSKIWKTYHIVQRSLLRGAGSEPTSRASVAGLLLQRIQRHLSYLVLSKRLVNMSSNIMSLW